MNAASEDNGMNHGETRPGWCSLCQVDCRTVAVLVSHSMGKRHKKQIERQNTGPEGLKQTYCPYSREQPEHPVAFEQMWQEISICKGPDGKESAEVSQKELQSATISKGSSFKEQLKCELCNMGFLSKKCLDAHLAGRRHAARHRTNLSEFEVASAGTTVDLDMPTDSGKKRCRADFEGEVELQSSVAGSNAAGQGEDKSKQVLLSVKSNSNGYNEEKQGDHLVPSSVTSHVTNVPVTGPEASAQHRKEIICELCNIECDSKISLQAHVAGKKHALKLKRSLVATDGRHCLKVSEEAKYSDAENGGDNKKNKRSGGEMERKKVPDCNKTASDGEDGGSIGGNAGTEEDRQISCNVCNIKCTTQKELEWHILGKRHAAHLKKLSASDVPASVGITRMPSECCNKVLRKEESLNGTAWNCSDVKHLSVRTVLGGPGDAALDEDNNIDETGCDLCNILCRDKFVPEDYAIGRKQVDHLGMLLTKGGSACANKAGAVNGDEFACAGAERFPVLETLAGARNKTEKGQIFSGSYGTDCAKNTESNSIFKIHANCLQKLLTMDEKACLGAVETMFRETRIAREREAVSHQLVSLWEGEGIQPEEQECNVCHVKCGSKKDLDGHLAGKKHAIQLKKLRGRCELCNVYCGTKKALKSHMAGRKHAAKVRLITGENGGMDVNDLSFPLQHENSGNSEDELKLMAGFTLTGQTGETLSINRYQGDRNAGDVLNVVEESKQIGQTDETVPMERREGDGNPENMLKILVESAQPVQTGESLVTETHQGNGNANVPKILEESMHAEKVGHPIQVDKNPDDVLKIPEERTQAGHIGEAP